MKLQYLVILLIIFSSCQTHNSGLQSDISNSLRTSGNPTLLAVQFLTCEIQKEKEEWPNKIDDYTESFGDSVRMVFSEFKNVDFNLQSDTLVMAYGLNDEWKVTNFNFELVDSNLYPDSASVRFKSDLKEMNNKNKFKTNEVRMSFIKENDVYIIIHEFRRGISRNKITPAQHGL